jgi:hypothetical protein
MRTLPQYQHTAAGIANGKYKDACVGALHSLLQKWHMLMRFIFD